MLSNVICTIVLGLQVCQVMRPGYTRYGDEDGHFMPPFSVEVEMNKDRWAHIVAGESGGAWPDASLLVAWTLRAYQVYQDMPADEAGKLWGWYGWKEPTAEARIAVERVWGRPLSESPYEFMQTGHYCKTLGSASDVRYWRSIGALGDPDLILPHPIYKSYSLNCYMYPKHAHAADASTDVVEGQEVQWSLSINPKR